MKKAKQKSEIEVLRVTSNRTEDRSEISNHQSKITNVFTLVELLVVIAIITILASMLLPVLQKVRDKAKSILCTNNLKSIGTTISYYNNDFDGFYPQSYPVRWYYTICILGYLEMKNYNNVVPNPANPSSIFVCAKDYDLIDNKYLYYGGYHGSYGPNILLIAQNQPNFKMTIAKKNTSKTILFGESATNRNPYASRSGNDLNIFWSLITNQSFSYPERWKHNKIQNTLYVDNHVEGIEFSDWTNVIVRPQ